MFEFNNYTAKDIDDIMVKFWIRDNSNTKTEKSIVSTVIKNDETGAIVEVELPGYKKEEISVTADNEILLVKVDGKRGKKSIKRLLSKDYDISSISASFEDGILTITIPCVKKNVVNVVVK